MHTSLKRYTKCERDALVAQEGSFPGTRRHSQPQDSGTNQNAIHSRESSFKYCY
jgi:hypothetical protein